jgi:hypothetical protein
VTIDAYCCNPCSRASVFETFKQPWRISTAGVLRLRAKVLRQATTLRGTPLRMTVLLIRKRSRTSNYRWSMEIWISTELSFADDK